MKNKIKYLVLVGLVALLPIKSKAAPLSGNFKFSCNDTNLKVGRSTKCSLKGTFGEEISGIELSISKTAALSISNFEVKNPLEKIFGNDYSNMVLNANDIISPNVERELVTFDVKLDSDAENQSITISDLSAADAQQNDERTYIQNPITVNFTNAKSTDNTLKTITVGNKTVNVTSATTYEFTTNNNVSKVNISAVANDSGASIIGGGEKTLSVGLNTFTISVEAEAGGTPKEYTIKITRSVSNNNNSDITIDNNTNNTNNTSNSNKNTSNSKVSTTVKSNSTKKSETIKNPKTGIYNSIGTGILIITVAAMTYIILRKEKYFNK